MSSYLPHWQTVFEQMDPGTTQFTIEQRHPFFDLRVAVFLAALPALPWCQEKNILKAAGHGILPDSVRLRPKAPLAGDPVWEHLRGCGPDWWAKHFQPVPELARYVNPDAIPRVAPNGYELMVDLQPVNLNYWLQLGRKSPKIIMEKKGLL